jgi:hypothetical protein
MRLYFEVCVSHADWVLRTFHLHTSSRDTEYQATTVVHHPLNTSWPLRTITLYSYNLHTLRLDHIPKLPCSWPLLFQPGIMCFLLNIPLLFDLLDLVLGQIFTFFILRRQAIRVPFRVLFRSEHILWLDLC